MHGLSNSELKQLGKWDAARLLDLFEGGSDRLFLIDLQDASGIAHKDDSDPDVASLIATYVALKVELEDRLKTSSALATTLESYANALAHNTAFKAGALGIPDDVKTDAQIAQVKADYNLAYAQIGEELGL